MNKITMRKKHDLTFEEGVKEYLLDCRKRNLRDGTLKHYRESAVSLYKVIPRDTPIHSFSLIMFHDSILKYKESNNVNDVSLYTYARDLKTFMYFFMKNDYIDGFKITLMKVDNDPIECYTDQELKILLKRPNTKLCSFSDYKAWVTINFLLSTGVRLNSLINIKIKDLDFDNDVVYVRTTKNRKSLIIPLNQTIQRILIEYLEFRQHTSEDEYLFCNVFGKKLVKSTIYHSISEYHHHHGINKTGIHRYRHTFAKKWILMGGNVVTLQRILGHSSLQITQNYLNLLVSDIKEDINKYNILDYCSNTTISMK